MRPQYHLVKFKAQTVNELGRLKDEIGQASLDNLIAKTIQLADAYRTGLKEDGWESSLAISRCDA